MLLPLVWLLLACRHSCAPDSSISRKQAADLRCAAGVILPARVRRALLWAVRLAPVPSLTVLSHLMRQVCARGGRCPVRGARSHAHSEPAWAPGCGGLPPGRHSPTSSASGPLSRGCT